MDENNIGNNDITEKAENPAGNIAEKAENAADSAAGKTEEKNPFGRIDFDKPLYQAAAEPGPQMNGPQPDHVLPPTGGPGMQPGGPVMQQGGPGVQPGGPMMQPGAPMMQQGGPMMQQGGPMPNGDGAFSPYGGPASQFGGAVPTPVEPVQFGGGYAQPGAGPQFQQGMGYQQAPAYQQPMGDMYYGYPDPYMPMMQQNNGSMGLGIASMVLGILALVTCCCWYICGPLAAIGLILGIIGIKSESGKGMAIAGVVCSGIALLILIAIVSYSCYAYGSAMNSFQNIFNNIP